MLGTAPCAGHASESCAIGGSVFDVSGACRLGRQSGLVLLLAQLSVFGAITMAATHSPELAGPDRAGWATAHAHAAAHTRATRAAVRAHARAHAGSGAHPLPLERLEAARSLTEAGGTESGGAAATSAEPPRTPTYPLNPGEPPAAPNGYQGGPNVLQLNVTGVEELRAAVAQANSLAADQKTVMWLAAGLYDLHDGPLRVTGSIEMYGSTDGGQTVFDCGLSNSEALVLTVMGANTSEQRSFDINDIVIRRCGGAAPVYVNAQQGIANVRVTYCSLEHNIGWMAGGVAVGGYLPTAKNNVFIVQTNFTGNAGVVDPGMDLSAFTDDGNNRLTNQRVLPASALSLGRGLAVVSECTFYGNGVAAPLWPLGSALQVASSATVDFNCDGGPASLMIYFSTFTGGNTGLVSGCVRVNGDSVWLSWPEASIDCSLGIYQTRMEGCVGQQAGSVLATCTYSGSSCTAAFSDSAVVGGQGARSGGVVVRGAGLFLEAKSNLTLADNVGGGIYSSGAAVTLRHSLIRNNTADAYGGISVWGAPVFAYNTTFAANTARRQQGRSPGRANVVMQSYGNNFTNCTFKDNVGTALYLGSVDFVVYGCRFSRNRAWPGTFGGAVHLTTAYADNAASASTSSIQNTLFEGNAAVAGGALYVGRGSRVYIRNCLVQGNRARSGGAVLLDEESDLAIANCQFSRNVAVGPDQVLYTSNSSADDSVSGAMEAAGRRAPSGSCGDGGGGALCLLGSTGVQVSLGNTSFADNAAMLGGGLYSANGVHCDAPGGCYRIEIDADVTFTGNHAELAGGAVYWLYEGILNITCKEPAPALAAAAWPGLLEELQGQAYQSRPLDASLGFSASGAAFPAAGKSPPPPLTPGEQLGALQGRAMPCASWTGNALGPGGYGPHIASSVFYYFPILGVKNNSSILGTPPAAMPGAAASPQSTVAQAQRQRVLQGSVEGGNMLPPPPAPMTSAESLAPLTVRLVLSGQPLPMMVNVFDYYGQQVTRSLVDSSVLILCTSLNALGQKAAETANGTADFSQLRVRDKVNATYTLSFEGRTPIRDLGLATLDIALRPCRINEELSKEGDACTPCGPNFYALSIRSGQAPEGNGSSAAAVCMPCPEGAICSNASLGGVVVPDQEYWHSAPLSAFVTRCPVPSACSYPNRSTLLGAAQAALLAVAAAEGGPTPGPLSDSAYRALQCAPGYWGNLCGSCAEGYGKTAQKTCVRCGGLAARFAYGLLIFGIALASIAATVHAALVPHMMAARGVKGGVQEQQSIFRPPGPEVLATGGGQSPARNGSLICPGSAAYGNAGGVPDGRHVGAASSTSLTSAGGPALQAPKAAILAAQDEVQRLGGSAEQAPLLPALLHVSSILAVPEEHAGEAPKPVVLTSRPGSGPPGSKDGLQQSGRRGQSGLDLVGDAGGQREPTRAASELLTSPLAANGSRPGSAAPLTENESKSVEPRSQLFVAAGEQQSPAHRRGEFGSGEPRAVEATAGTGSAAAATSGRVAELEAPDGLRVLPAAACSGTERAGQQPARATAAAAAVAEAVDIAAQSMAPSLYRVEAAQASGHPGHAPLVADATDCDGGPHATIGAVPAGKLGGQEEDATGTLHPLHPPGSFRRRVLPHKLPPLRHSPSASPAAADGRTVQWKSPEGSPRAESAAATTSRDASPDARPRPRGSRRWTRQGGSWRKQLDGASEHATIIKIMVSYLQVVSLVKNTPVVWPSALVNYFSIAAQFSSAAFSIGSLECGMRSGVVPKSVQTFLVAISTPAYWSAALCVFWLLRAAWLRRRGRMPNPQDVWNYLRVRLIITTNCVIFLQYPTVVSQLLSLFSCQQLDPGPAQTVCTDPWDAATCRTDRLSVGRYWSQDLQQRCYEGLHLRLCLIAGVPGLLLFAAGVPLLSAWWLHAHRDELEDEAFAALYGTLYQEYEAPHHYWESVVLLRKLAVAAVIVFAGTYRWQLTLLLALGVVALAFIAQAWYKPYKTDAMDKLELLGLVVTLITFYLASFFMGDTVGSSVRVGLSFAVLIVNAMAVAVFVAAIARELCRAAVLGALRRCAAGEGDERWYGDLPLVLMLRVGASYVLWRWRLLRLRVRGRLFGLAPRCWPMGMPPGALVVASATAAAVHPACSPAGRDAADSETQGPVSSGRTHFAAPESSAAAPAAALCAAWAAHYQAEWLNRVSALMARAGDTQGDDRGAETSGVEAAAGATGAVSPWWSRALSAPALLSSRFTAASRRLPDNTSWMTADCAAPSANADHRSKRHAPIGRWFG